MIRVAIIGCGKIADAHAEQIGRIPGCEIVGACDREELMALQFAERFPVQKYYSDAATMLREARPTVVHITTPPQGHYELGRACLEAGCHVYLEKPFTVTAGEAGHLIELAERSGLKITAGHDDQFTHATRRMRELVREGYLGGPPVHMESVYCYDLGDPKYARSLLGDKRHWIRSLPGTLMQNNISHGISRIAEFLPDGDIEVTARGFISPALWDRGEREIVDEVRVIVSDKRSVSAVFTFSTQMRPAQRVFRIYGPRNAIVLDHHQQTVLKIRGAMYKSYLEKFIPPYELAAQYVQNSLLNTGRFLRRDFHMKAGMKYLIESFYRSIEDDLPPPIPSREILLTARIMDEIFSQVNRTKGEEDLAPAAIAMRTGTTLREKTC
jgi:predicted dehydrogenase